jgi:hypothetical protein
MRKVVELHERAERAEADADRLAALLARVEPELIPNHDAAVVLSQKFGLGSIHSALVYDIREALRQHEETKTGGVRTP